MFTENQTHNSSVPTVEDWELDDWHAPIISNTNTHISFDDTPEDVDVAVTNVERVQNFNSKPQENKTLQQTSYRCADLEELATHAVQIFKNQNINSSTNIVSEPDIYKLRITGSLNSVYEVRDVARFLKVAIDYYKNKRKTTTTKNEAKKISDLVKAIDKINGKLSDIRNKIAKEPHVLEHQENIAIQTHLLLALEKEQTEILSVCVEEKKNSSAKLMETATNVLRILSKNNERANRLHSLLLQKINPVRYFQSLAEKEENIRIAQEQEELSREKHKEQRELNYRISKFSDRDKENYMTTKRMYYEKKNIPLYLAKYLEIIQKCPHLSFEVELEQKPVEKKKVTMTFSSNESHTYRQQYPSLGEQVKVNAWTQKLGTKKEKKSTVIGAWTQSLDKQKLASIPDPVVKKENSNSKIVKNTNENEEDEDDYDDYENDRYFYRTVHESDDEFGMPLYEED